MDFDLAFKMSPLMVALIPLTMAIVGVLRIYIDTYYAPALSLCVGLVLAVIATDTSFSQTVIAGLVVGTSAAGTYSGVKKAMM